jgi:hypothetical protein
MAASPQPEFRNVNYSSVTLQTPKQKYSKKTTSLARKKRSSATLQLLTWLQKGSSSVAAIAMLGGISVYVATVRIPQLWTQEYENLEELQLQERQLVAIDESLKYEIAQKAQQTELEMSPISPENTIFLKPNSVTPQFEKAISGDRQLPQSIPLGY